METVTKYNMRSILLAYISLKVEYQGTRIYFFSKWAYYFKMLFQTEHEFVMRLIDDHSFQCDTSNTLLLPV